MGKISASAAGPRPGVRGEQYGQRELREVDGSERPVLRDLAEMFDDRRSFLQDHDQGGSCSAVPRAGEQPRRTVDTGAGGDRACPERMDHQLRGAMTSVRVMVLAGVLALSTMPLGIAAAPAEAAQPAAAAQPFTAMTWNIHFGVGGVDGQLNLGRIRDEIAKWDPTVVALQEIRRDHQGTDQIKWMKERLRDLGYKDFYGSPPGKMGNLIASKHNLRNKGYADLPHDDHGRTGILLHATVERDGPDVRVYSTHLQSPDTDYHRKLRNKEVRYILENARIDRLHDPVVLMGDFNLRPENKMKSVIANRGFIDTWTTVRDSAEGVTTTKGHDGTCRANIDKVKRIDYIFGSPAIVADNAYIGCQTKASDHKPVIMRLRVEPKDIEISGAVRTGDLGRAGWAHLIVYTDKTSKLITCDNNAGDWRVTSRGYVPYQGDNFVESADGGSEWDRCRVQRSTGATANFRHVALKACVKNTTTGAVRDCRKHGMLERVYMGREMKAGYAQYRVGVDNRVTAKVCDTKADGWTVRSFVYDGEDLLVTWVKSAGNGSCRSNRGPWSWTRNGLRTETCLVNEGETEVKGCKRKPMAYAT
ncbi:MAG: hypothetical protein GEV03_28885 [Streptosporangiales bacterium]|nr:hypothetical protein [Streptosporangiales bacterium]